MQWSARLVGCMSFERPDPKLWNTAKRPQLQGQGRVFVRKQLYFFTSVALEVVENKELKNTVVFFSVASFSKCLVFNELVSRAGQSEPEKV